MAALGTMLVVVGWIMAAVGGLWLLVVAFQESVPWGLGCLIIPIVALVFVITHWDQAGKPFLIKVAGAVAVIAGMAMST